MHAEIAAIERAIKAATASRGRADIEAHTVASLLRAGVGTAVRERHRPGIILSPHAEEGLVAYLNGPVATQINAEIGKPADVTFVFGHTHKPFVEKRTCSTFPSPVDVVNTGGWVVDTPQLNPLKGASLVVIDECLNAATLRCYAEGPDASSYRVSIAPVNADGPNDLVEELRSAIDPDRDPWAQFAQVTRATVDERARQLADRLRTLSSDLNQLNLKADGRSASS
jgi:hypothetical protein